MRSFGQEWIEIALEEARSGLAEGGQPVGAVLLSGDNFVLGRGRNRFVQTGRILAHAEVEAFEDAPLQDSYADCTIVTTASPCWYCCGLIRHFGIGRVVIGAASGRKGGASWLEEIGVEVLRLRNPECLGYLGAAGAGR